MNRRDESNDRPTPFDWTEVAGQSATTKRPVRTEEITEKDVWKALEAGAVGGALIGILWNLASGTAFGATVIAAAFAGTILWAPLALGVKASARSRGLGASLLRLLFGAAVVVYGLVFVVVIGWALWVHIKVHQTKPKYQSDIPRATIGVLAPAR